MLKYDKIADYFPKYNIMPQKIRLNLTKISGSISGMEYAYILSDTENEKSSNHLEKKVNPLPLKRKT